MHHITYYRMLSAVNNAVDLSKTLLLGAATKLSLIIKASAESLEARIPDFKPYVVDVYNPEMIKSELLDASKTWDDFATFWVALTKTFSVARNFASRFGDEEFKFDLQHADVCAVFGQHS